jgi:hypothetical protein
MTILVADDHAIVKEGSVSLLKQQTLTCGLSATASRWSRSPPPGPTSSLRHLDARIQRTEALERSPPKTSAR